MYNEQVKEEYLNTVSTSVNYLLNNLFAKTEMYEKLKGKDVCDFIEEDILEFFTGMASSSINTIASNASVLRSYTQWCCDNNINKDHINHFDNINVEMLSECVNHIVNQEKYITLDELHRIMDNSIVNVCDKYLVYALFWGISGKDSIELTNVTADAVDKENNRIKLVTGREVYAPTELCNMVIQSCNEYSYLLTSGKRFDSLKLDETDQTAFKKRSNARFSTQEKARLRVVGRLIKLRDTTESIALTTDRLKNSGVLHCMKKVMEEKGISAEDIYHTKEMRIIQKQYDIENQPSYQLKAKFKDFL